MEQFYEVPEIMKFLCMSESSIRRLVREDKIPYYKIKGKILFRKSELISWITEKREGGK